VPFSKAGQIERNPNYMCAKIDFSGHRLEITNVHGKPGFYNIKVDGLSDGVTLDASQMTKCIRQLKEAYADRNPLPPARGGVLAQSQPKE
jgi:hypothetical protein